MIIHSVVFTLTHPSDSAEEAAFLDTALTTLARIPGVEGFQMLRQVSPKSDFRFSFTMQFADANVYQNYNEHPDHVAFVANRWVPEVVAFQELDFEPLSR
jgi:hypothetical protein